MTIASTAILIGGGTAQQGWNTELNASHTTAQEKLGAIRWDLSDKWGLRGFQYVRFDQSGTVSAGALQSYRANVAVNNITSGTTTSITTTGLTADIYVNGWLRCYDDAGAAGAAPEGEVGFITKNTTTTITIDAGDAFTAAPAANDDFEIILPWAVNNSASGDEAAQVAGLVMASQAQYSYGWVQFYGLYPKATLVAAGTAVPVEESLIAGTALLTDGAGATLDQRVAFNKSTVSSDTVLRQAMVFMYCGPIYKMGTSTP